MAKKLAMLFGVVFLVVGVLGFFPNSLVSATGYFQADMAHNIIHVVTGLILIYVASKTMASAKALKIVGVIYLLVAILGFLFDGSILGITDVNGHDNWLHVVLGVLILLSGYSKKNDDMPMSMPM